jgi:hypothetical protein
MVVFYSGATTIEDRISVFDGRIGKSKTEKNIAGREKPVNFLTVVLRCSDMTIALQLLRRFCVATTYKRVRRSTAHHFITRYNQQGFCLRSQKSLLDRVSTETR